MRLIFEYIVILYIWFVVWFILGFFYVFLFFVNDKIINEIEMKFFYDVYFLINIFEKILWIVFIFGNVEIVWNLGVSLVFF